MDKPARLQRMKKSECARPSTPGTGTVGPLDDLLLKWREDAGETYQAWFYGKSA